MSVCRRYTPNRMEAEDWLQLGFLRVFVHLNQFQGGSLEGWMKRIFVTVCLNQWRKTKRISEWQSVGEEAVFEDENGLQKLQAAELMKMIEGLPEGARIIFNLFAIEGFHHSEIAKMLGISESASRAQLTRARKILQEQLKQLS